MEPVAVAPLLDLRLRTARLELRLPVGDELVQLARLAEAGIHPPETMPFRVAWSDEAGKPSFLASFVAFHEGQRTGWRRDRWALVLGVWAKGELAGTQSLEAVDFAVSRTVSTGSWLGRRFQRRGFGTEMRAAVLDLAFAGLGAARALSGAIEGNVASERVSAKLGYEAGGERIVAPRGEPVRELELVLTREVWERYRKTPVVIEGLDACLPLFGLSRMQTE
jgi:RimJ/RimL family protein N-acetyltransferase